MKGYGATFMPLWNDNEGIMQSGNTWEKTTSHSSEKTQEQWRMIRASRQKRNETLQKEAERAQRDNDIVEMERRAMACNASKRHLATFVTVIREGIEHHQTIAICSFSKLMKEKDKVKGDIVKREWGAIRKWLKDREESKHIAIAITIGREPRGRYFLRCLAMGDNSNVSTFFWMLGQYLTGKRKWTTKVAALNSNEWDKWQKYYMTPDIYHFIHELFAIYRTSLMLDRRTYRNQHTTDIMERRKMHVPYECSYPVNAPYIKGNSISGVAFCAIETDNRKRIVNAYPVNLCEYGEWEEQGAMVNGDF